MNTYIFMRLVNMVNYIHRKIHSAINSWFGSIMGYPHRCLQTEHVKNTSTILDQFQLWKVTIDLLSPLDLEPLFIIAWWMIAQQLKQYTKVQKDNLLAHFDHTQYKDLAGNSLGHLRFTISTAVECSDNKIHSKISIVEFELKVMKSITSFKF